MIRQIVRSELLLKRPAQDATEADAQVARDLLDTLRANSATCVGMAANMIGAPKRIIAFVQGSGPKARYRVMFNPEVVKSAGAYEAEEGCLSLEGTRKATRYRTITVRFQDEGLAWHEERFQGWTAQIVQHEIDHTHGILI